MFAQHASTIDQETNAPRQLFLTKNPVLCNEVQRSFGNMGLAWRKLQKTHDNSDSTTPPKFLTSNQWLHALDVELPGERFFTTEELVQRVDGCEQDFIANKVEDLLANVTRGEAKAVVRQEMTYTVFRKLWRKIHSGSKMDCTIVWREIKSYVLMLG